MLSDDSSDEEQFVERLADEREYEERCAESGHPIEEPYWRDSYFRQDEADSPGPLELYDIPDDRAYNNTIGSLHDFAALTHQVSSCCLVLPTRQFRYGSSMCYRRV
jgi:hypothetical protein